MRGPTIRATAAERSAATSLLHRRAFASKFGALLFSLPALVELPRSAAALPRLPDLMTGLAGPGGVQLFGPSGELGRLSEARAQLESLSTKLGTEYKGDAEDSIVVLKISAIYFRSTVGVMAVTTEAMDELEPAEVEDANKLTAAFDDAVKALEQGCRDKDLNAQKDGVALATKQLAGYLELAQRHYTVPVVRIQ